MLTTNKSFMRVLGLLSLQIFVIPSGAFPCTKDKNVDRPTVDKVQIESGGFYSWDPQGAMDRDEVFTGAGAELVGAVSGLKYFAIEIGFRFYFEPAEIDFRPGIRPYLWSNESVAAFVNLGCALPLYVEKQVTEVPDPINPSRTKTEDVTPTKDIGFYGGLAMEWFFSDSLGLTFNPEYSYVLSEDPGTRVSVDLRLVTYAESIVTVIVTPFI